MDVAGVRLGDIEWGGLGKKNGAEGNNV